MEEYGRTQLEDCGLAKYKNCNDYFFHDDGFNCLVFRSGFTKLSHLLLGLLLISDGLLLKSAIHYNVLNIRVLLLILISYYPHQFTAYPIHAVTKPDIMD